MLISTYRNKGTIRGDAGGQAEQGNAQFIDGESLHDI